MPNSWPTGFPTPSINGYRFTAGKTFTRTDVEQGPARQRRRFTSAPAEVQTSWTLTLYQFETFEAWWIHTLQGGADWFSVPLGNGKGRQTVTARFTQPYEASWIGSETVRVTGSLEVTDFPTLTAVELAARL